MIKSFDEYETVTWEAFNSQQAGMCWIQKIITSVISHLSRCLDSAKLRWTVGSVSRLAVGRLRIAPSRMNAFPRMKKQNHDRHHWRWKDTPTAAARLKQDEINRRRWWTEWNWGSQRLMSDERIHPMEVSLSQALIPGLSAKCKGDNSFFRFNSTDAQRDQEFTW